MNKGQEVKKNLKHGYIFLIITLLIPFSIALGFELYTTGQLKISGEDDTNTPISYPTEEPEEEPEDIKKPTLEIKNLEDGFTTKETSVVLVASTEVENSAWINGNEITVSGDGSFEYKIELIEGENKIEVKVENGQGLETSATIHVNREVEKKPDPEPVNPPSQQPAPSPQPNPAPTPNPTPTPTPTPTPSPVSGLKLQCSITNTAPFPGESVSVNCTVRDQNNNPVSGAFGYVTMSWKSGSSVYTLSQSNGGGSMTVSFTVPTSNSGGNSGNVQVSKDGLNVNSNFNLNVQ